MISFQFLAASRQGGHAHPEIELLYCIRGHLHLRASGIESDLHADDFVMVNSGTIHEYEGSGDLLIGEFHIQPDKLSEAIGRENLRFRCNSAVTEEPERYVPVREVILEIFSRYQQNSRDTLRMNSLYYRLLYLLSANFLTAEPASQEPQAPVAGRAGEITEYIRLNYDKPIRLIDLADQLHLSVAYLSKYIKRQLGMSFLDYVSQVRLSHAVTALLHSNTPVARIAMDTGFANMSAFNKTFREVYHTTPSAFRTQYRNSVSMDSSLPITEQEEPAVIRTPQEEFSRVAYLTVSVPEAPIASLPSGHVRMINIGACADLLRADIQSQVLLLRDRLHITHLRFWDLYSPDMLLDRPDENGFYSFQRLDRVLDFLLRSGIKPYLELGDKKRQVFLSNPRRQEPGVLHRLEGAEEYEAVLSQLLAHLAQRYGAEELKSWYFELWKSEERLKPGADEEAEIRSYLDRFSTVRGILDRIAPGLQLGGGGFSLRYGEEAMQQVISLWADHPVHPDFLSLYCYPTLETEDKAAVLENQLVNPNSLQTTLECLRRVTSATSLRSIPIHVTEWNISIQQRSALNDSYFKGAYIIKNLMDTLGLADLYGYWLATDLYSEGSDSALPFFGGCGILTRDSIPKPSWYALEFLGELGGTVFAQGEHYIVTRDQDGVWRVLCHNFKPFNYRYYLNEDESLPAERLEDLLSDTTSLNIRFELPAAPGSAWRFRRSRIGKDSGNAREIWSRSGASAFPNTEELEDLRRASAPQVALGSIEEQDGVLSFQVHLDYNEAVLLVLTSRN
ncbi:MAG: helix-turn-helix domain-containing protein [Oscillospiraceae bacterium]|nr:helix-turn-helix domain-containing protein [Oscillospiraceae bacterium]